MSIVAPIPAQDQIKPYEIDDAIVAFTDGLLSATKTALVAAIVAAKPNGCPKCKTLGRYVGSVDSGVITDTDKVECTVCDGFGYTTLPYIPVITGYELAPA